MTPELRVAYKTQSPLIVEDVAKLMSRTTDTGQRAGIGLVLAHFLTMRSTARSAPKERTPKTED